MSENFRTARQPSWAWFAGCIAGFAAAGAALISAGDWLVVASPLFGIPWGTLVAAALLAFPSLAALAVIRAGRLLWPARVMAGLAVLWLPVSMAMAGNIYLNDFGDRYDVFRAYSVVCVVVPALLVVAWFIDSLLARRN